MEQNITTGRVTGDGFSMPYAQFGKGGRSFVILPGMSLHPVVPLAEQVAGQYALFGRDYTVTLFDRTENMPEGYSVRDMARDTAAAMEILGLRRADIFGASQGGMMALCLALDYPELVRRLALGSTLSRSNPVAFATFTEWKRLSEAGDPVALNRSCVSRIYSPATQEAFREAFAAQEMDGTAEELRRYAILSAASRDFDVYSELPRLQCPVLVLGARDDRVLDAVGSTEIAERLHCECYLYENCGHAAFDEVPDYADRLFRFFGRELPC